MSPILPAGCLGMGRGSQLWWGSFPVEDAAGMQERLALASRSLGDCVYAGSVCVPLTQCRPVPGTGQWAHR